MKKNRKDAPEYTVTAEYAIKLLPPTLTNGAITLRAPIVESAERKAVVKPELEAGGEVCATCRGTFVSVKSKHPYYSRSLNLIEIISDT